MDGVRPTLKARGVLRWVGSSETSSHTAVLHGITAGHKQDESHVRMIGPDSTFNVSQLK